MLQLHLAGRLVRDPEKKTSKNGKGYVHGLLLVTAGETDTLTTVMAFEPDLQAVLIALRKGDSVSAIGSGSVRAYIDKGGQPAAVITMMANRLMTMAMTEAKATVKSKGDLARNGHRRIEGQYSVDSAATQSELPPAEAYDDEIPF